MYAYVDESGNTGPNLFDENQPIFTYGTLITRNDFDDHFSSEVKRLAERTETGVFHAAEMGVAKISPIAFDLSQILKKADAKIHICRVRKVDLAATKLFDTIFDSGENLFVPWHVYNMRPLRLLLLIKFAYLLDEQLLEQFWTYFRKRKEHEVTVGLSAVLKEIKNRVHILPDEHSRERIGGAIDWALANPEAIHAHSAGKLQRNSHYPNIVVFPELLKGIDNWSTIWGDPVKTIKHDKQDQFKPALKYWHEILSNAPATPISIIGEDDVVLRRVFESDLVLTKDSDSCGLQVVDVILWLLKKSEEGLRLSNEFSELIQYLAMNSSLYELSLQSITYYLEKFFNMLNAQPITEEALEEGKKLLKIAEERRQEKMLGYANKKFSSLQ